MHMSLLVVGNDSLEEMMEPFYQDLEVEEHCEGEVTESDKKFMMDIYRARGKEFKDFDDCYRQFGEDWNNNMYRKDEDGVWREYSTSNPEMRWDWYEIGGRWPGKLELKHGVENTGGVHFSWGWTQEQIDKFNKEYPNRTDIAVKGDVANLDTLVVYAILINGEWIELDPEPDCKGNVSQYLEGVPDDTMLTMVDYHM